MPGVIAWFRPLSAPVFLSYGQGVLVNPGGSAVFVRPGGTVRPGGCAVLVSPGGNLVGSSGVAVGNTGVLVGTGVHVAGSGVAVSLGSGNGTGVGVLLGTGLATGIGVVVGDRGRPTLGVPVSTVTAVAIDRVSDGDAPTPVAVGNAGRTGATPNVDSLGSRSDGGLTPVISHG